MTSTKPAIEVKKIGRSFCVVAGASVLGKFKTEANAVSSLADDAEFYRFWAGSASVSVQNAKAAQ